MPQSSTPTSVPSASHSKRSAAPVVIELDYDLGPRQVARRLQHLPKLLVMESAMRHPLLGRYSFVTADPIQWFQASSDNPEQFLSWLDENLKRFACLKHEGLPPFQGGIAGLLDYEFNRVIEPTLPSNNQSEFGPAQFGIYDVVIAWDHEQNRTWLISQGTVTSPQSAKSGQTRQEARIAFAEKRAALFRNLLEAKQPQATFFNANSEDSEAQLESDFQKDEYLPMIDRAIEYIQAGDIFQVNLAQQLSQAAHCKPLTLFDRLCTCNAATFAAFLDLGDRQIISASPERLVSVRDRHVETRPIKGTRRRTKHPEVDIDVGRELLSSEKDRAENVMIVDLMRNDLSRVCTNESVNVTQFVELEEYASVLHLVSAVEGDLLDEVTASQLLRAVFPGGSITGAPKFRAMEIIGELEKAARDAYCGSLGYFGFDGSIDLNILIRTITAANGRWTFPVGGGITVNSSAAMEYEETLTKAKGMLDAMEQGRGSP